MPNVDPAAILEGIMPMLRETFPRDKDFLEANRHRLVQIVELALTERRVGRGAPPTTPLEWMEYQVLMTRERKHDLRDDPAVLRRLAARSDKLRAGGDLVHVQNRAAAIFLGQAGYEALALLTRSPVLTLLDRGFVVGIRTFNGQLHFDHDPPAGRTIPDRALQAALAAADQRVEQISRDIGESNISRYALALWSRARGAHAPALTSDPTPLPPELRDKPGRTSANVHAIRLLASKAPSELTPEERDAIGQYSGWGGLSIDAVRGKLPADLLPETFGLIHEYYTPSVIAEALVSLLCPFLPELASADGVVRALEPSAGIGRLLRAFSPRLCLSLESGGQIARIDWTAVEFSAVSAKLLRALRPDVDLHHMPFERWIRLHGARHRGTINLILSNPPYGERGEFALEDPEPEYKKENRAFAYFMRRCLDLLVPGGIGVFLIPAGFLSGNLNRPLRTSLLRRNHLLGAYRLPSHSPSGRENVPGASIVMDIVVWRSRGGELREIDVDDRYIVDGGYFQRHPEHILGEEDGAFAGDDQPGLARSWRYKVTGELGPLPELTPRPVCTACVLTSIDAPAESRPFQTVSRDDDDAHAAEAPDDLRPALALGKRAHHYTTLLGADEAQQAAQLWPELHNALLDFRAAFGVPEHNKPLRDLAAAGRVAAQQLLNAFDRLGNLSPAFREPPKIVPKYTGPARDVIAQAEALFHQNRDLTVDQLLEFHRRVGGDLPRDQALKILLDAGWNLDGLAWDHLLPTRAYCTGNDLWARHDRAHARAEAGDEQARVQVRRLLAAIKPAVFEDLSELSPQEGYIPLDLVAGWMSETLNYGRPIQLEREAGLVQVVGHKYTSGQSPLSAPALSFLGFYNHDPALFRPPRDKDDDGPTSREEKNNKKQSIAERRIKLANEWALSFRRWIADDDARRARLVDAYNRSARGRIVPEYPPEKLEIARWGPNSPQLKNHQISGARRVLAQGGGLIAFDVGVGKTYTALAIIARARQEGWVRRPVILVPSSLVWKWHDDVLCTLPDYRVLVIGSKRKVISRGARKGLITSETDTPQERASKWLALQSGQVDVVILSFDAMSRTKMSQKAVLEYISSVQAITRSIELRRRALAEQASTPKGKLGLTERETALLDHGVSAWVHDILALPSGWDYDPGIAWDEIGIDMLVVDEAAAFKNLYKPQPREDGVPKFMGGGGDGSDRAWQMDFRAAAVRRKTGGAGIVLLTATPAKNSPLEFYNLIQFIDPSAFTAAGIMDPEQFIDRFIRIERRQVLDTTFNVEERSAVVGFRNLDDLRTIIHTYGEFRTAEEVGLVLPRPVVETLTITMDAEQEEKYGAYVGEIERIINNPDPQGAGNVILGLLARLSLIALHPALEEGYTYQTALEGGAVKRQRWVDGQREEVTIYLDRPNYESPKLLECARRVVASPHCGHIIFCDPTAVHQWMREVLVAQGIPRERIAILNADATSPADRIRIAREFNGLSSEPPAPGSCARPSDSTTAPKFDVVIANSVAYEGIDLQVRTCSIHHIDLPWTPADLEQRNGRAVRQGNTLGTVAIYYYFADGSTDGYRFSLISGKAGWLGDLLKGSVRDTNNPAAQQQLTPEDILLMVSRDKERTRKILEAKKERAAEAARARIATEAARQLRQAAARFAEARRVDDPERALALREQGEARLRELDAYDQKAWPWGPWAHVVRTMDVIVPDDGAPIYEGLRITRDRVGFAGEFEHLEIGRIRDGIAGLRAAGSPSWQQVSYDGTLGHRKIDPREMPREGGPQWPDDDDLRTGEAIETLLQRLARYGSFADLGWRAASDAFVEKWWTRFERGILTLLLNRDDKVPAVTADERLIIAEGEDLRGEAIKPLLPTSAGWRRFLELAPASGLAFGLLKDLGLSWWGLKIPHNLLAKQKDADAADAADAPQQPEPAPAAPAPEPVRAEAPPKPEPEPVPEPEPKPKRGIREQFVSMLDTLDLPAKQYRHFLELADKAIAKGKSVRSIFKKAEDAAAKFKASPNYRRVVPQVSISGPMKVVAGFNALPKWRVEFIKRHGSGQITLAVYREGGDPRDAVASIDVLRDEIDEVRWLVDLSPVDQDEILTRLNHTIQAALDSIGDDPEFTGKPPIDELIEMMKLRGRALGVDPIASSDLARDDGYAQIATVLRDLADPGQPEELTSWLQSQDYPGTAEIIRQAIAGDPVPVHALMNEIWDSIADNDPPESISGKGGVLLIPQDAIHKDRAGKHFVLVREGNDARRVDVALSNYDEDTDSHEAVPAARLFPFTELLRNDRDASLYVELFQRIRAFEADLRRAPEILRQIRILLFWTGAMLDAPRCQGDVKRRATRAFESAKALYDTARERLTHGYTLQAVGRMKSALHRISAAAAEIAKSCGEGQITLVDAELDVTPEDRKTLEQDAVQ
jgi:hypothetical protein